MKRILTTVAGLLTLGVAGLLGANGDIRFDQMDAAGRYVQKVAPLGTNGQVWTLTSGVPGWANSAGGGGGTWGSITGTLSAQTDLQAALDAKQALDADLTSLAGASGLNTIYYRSAANTWAPVAIGANLTFTGGTLAATGSGGVAWGSISGTLSAQTDLNAALAARQPADADLTTFAGITPSADVQSLLGAADYAAMRLQLGLVIGTNVQAFDADLASLSGAAGTNTIYYRSAAGTWTAVTVGTNLTFAGGTLAATGGGTPGGSDTQIQFNDGGAFGGDSTFTFNKTTDTMTLTTLNVTTLNATNATVPTPTVGDNDTSIATTAFVQTEVDATQSGVHATPVTGTQTPTWSGPMHTVWCGATQTINLPAAAGYLGRGIAIYNTGAFTITIDPNGTEVVVRDGTVQTGGVSFTLSSGAGNYVTLISDGARWITLGSKGTLAVGT